MNQEFDFLKLELENKRREFEILQESYMESQKNCKDYTKVLNDNRETISILKDEIKTFRMENENLKEVFFFKKKFFLNLKRKLRFVNLKVQQELLL